MRFQKRTIDGMVRKASRLWGLEDWDLTWEYGRLSYEACIDATHWTEKRAHITLDREAVSSMERKHLFRVVLHEAGHCVVYPIWRCMLDWSDNLMDKKVRATLEDNVNSAENVVIDYIITKVMGQ